MRLPLRRATLVVLAALALAACEPETSSSTSSTRSGDRTVAAGNHVVIFRNDGQQSHGITAVRLGKGASPDDALGAPHTALGMNLEFEIP